VISSSSWALACGGPSRAHLFATSGPLIGLLVEGRPPGDEILLLAGGGTLEVEAWAQSVLSFHELQLVVNGQVVRHVSRLRKLCWRHGCGPGCGWRRAPGSARCVNQLGLRHCWPIQIAAIASPVYVRCGDEELLSPSDASRMLTLIDGGLTWLNTLSVPASFEHHVRIRGVFEEARTSLSHRLAEHGDRARG